MSMRPAVSDEDLMAYADGELGDADATRVGRAIDNDPELAARLKVFRVTGRALAPHFDAIDLADPPAKMLEAIRSTPVRTRAAEPSLLSRLSGMLEGLGLGGSPGRALATGVAAGLLIAAAAAQLPLLSGGSLLATQADGTILASGRLAKILESTPSRPPASGDIVALSSFEAEGQRYCRLYQALRQTGLACRNSAGRWQVIATGEGDAGAGADTTQPSGGSGSSAVIDLVGPMMTSPTALDPASEAEIIKRGWTMR